MPYSATTSACVVLPIMIQSDGRAVAAVHAGWRGVVDGVLPAAVATLASRLNVAPAKLFAAIGPCIGVGHFEVGPEVAEAFAAAGLGNHVDHSHAKPHIDLAAAITGQLCAAGVPASHIDRSDACTYRDRDEFFSHRRDQGKTGRMAAVIGVASK